MDLLVKYNVISDISTQADIKARDEFKTTAYFGRRALARDRIGKFDGSVRQLVRQYGICPALPICTHVSGAAPG